jgi:hypothetical protein
MRMFTILLLIYIGTPIVSAQTQRGNADPDDFELEGDSLGETLASFISHHPKIRCVDSTVKTKNCYQWEDVSIYGMHAHPDPECSPEKHSLPICAQGLTATFKDQHLAFVSYAVEGTDKTDAVAKLKNKYPNTSMDTREVTIWVGSSGVLSVVVGKATDGTDGPTLVTFMIYAT